jgi:monooxygenase
MAVEHVDVLIVGAGISGIGAAVHLQKECPSKSFAIFERRADFGGTWSLFKYPGIRSDSDMYTLGFRFKPWTAEKAIADAPTILNYLSETVDEYKLKEKIRFGQHVQRASWSTETGLWTVEGTSAGKPMSVTCNMLFMCSGYYDYDNGFTPDFAGRAAYKGVFIHPQLWPDNLDYKGKSVVVIGSGATAVTLVPAMADNGAGHVTMLQRSPTYMVSRPSIDSFARAMQRWLPAKPAYAITRWRNVFMQLFTFNLARSRPAQLKKKLLEHVQAELGPDYDVATHFTPRYNPWEERLCLVPDSDIFKAINDGRASVVTDHIDSLTPTGIRLKSGKELQADIIVSATGLNLKMVAGMETIVDGKPINFGERVLYKGIMFDDVPNLAMWFGYTNASWTLKADLTSEYMCRVINHLDATGQKIAIPVNDDPNMETGEFVDFSSGYFQRASGKLPRQGTKLPWKLHQNYAKDIWLLRRGPVTDAMEFSNPHPVSAAVDAPALLEAAE